MGLQKGEIAATPLEVVTSHRKTLDIDLPKLAKFLAQQGPFGRRSRLSPPALTA